VVRGEGEVRTLPDRATIRVTVEANEVSRDDAYRGAAGLSAAVDAVLQDEEGAIDRVITTGLVVQPRTRWRKGEAVRSGWRASRTTVVELAVLDHVGELLARLVGAGASISGPEWSVSATHEAQREARRDAALDARRRAEDYAAALGLTLTGVAWVSEPGLRGGGEAPPVPMARAAAMARFAGEAAEEAPIDVSPEEITVRASVEVGFALFDG